jgi:hypothetical protein
MFKFKLKLYYDRRSVGQSVLVSGNSFEPATNFSSFLELFLDGFWFNDVECFLWQEVGSVILSWVQCIDSMFETPPTWRIMFLYLFTQEQGNPLVYCLWNLHFISWCIHSSYMHNTYIGSLVVQVRFSIFVPWRSVQVATQFNHLNDHMPNHRQV